MSLNVRPNKIIEAALWIIRNSELYRDEGVTFNENRIADYQHELSQQENENILTDITTSTAVINNSEIAEVTSFNENCFVENSAECSENEVEMPPGVSDTMLTPTDFLDDDSRDKILNVAPGEGNKPLSIFQDKYSEEMAYPYHFLVRKDLIMSSAK